MRVLFELLTRFDETFVVRQDIGRQPFRGGAGTDEDEQGISLDLAGLFGFHVFKYDTLQGFVPQGLDDLGFAQNFDIGNGLDLVDQVRRHGSREVFAADHDVDFVGKLGKVHCALPRRVAATDHINLFVATGIGLSGSCTVIYTRSSELIGTFGGQFAVIHPRRNDHTFGVDLVAVPEGQFFVIAFNLNFIHAR